MLADRFQVREYLGRGGYATVYRAYDRLLQVEVALKVLHPERDPQRALVRLARLTREVAIARRSLDRHLARVFDLGRTSEDLYLTMEILRGGSLRDRLGRGPLPIPEALRVATAVLKGLDALHAQNAVHRDVTPGNILFTGGGEVKLADFGLARTFGGEESSLTPQGAILGTAGYRSPEQSCGQEARPASDLYALGVVLFEMLVGRLPHAALAALGYPLAPLQPAPNLRSVKRDAPRWLAAVVARLLEVRTDDRYPNAEEVLADLARESSPRRRLPGSE